MEGEFDRDPAVELVTQVRCRRRHRGPIQHEISELHALGYDVRHLGLRQSEPPGDVGPARRRRAVDIRQHEGEDEGGGAFASAEKRYEFRHALRWRQALDVLAAGRRQQPPDELRIVLQQLRTPHLGLQDVERVDGVCHPLPDEMHHARARMIEFQPPVGFAAPGFDEACDRQQRQHGLQHTRADLLALRAQLKQAPVGRSAIRSVSFAVGIKVEQIAHRPEPGFLGEQFVGQPQRVAEVSETVGIGADGLRKRELRAKPRGLREQRIGVAIRVMKL